MGFLIDAVTRRRFLRSGGRLVDGKNQYGGRVTTDVVNLAEIIVLRLERCRFYAGLLLMVWVLKREVRAFGGCLGMYRRRRTWHAAISVGEL
jgi:hypothetical protein